MNELQVWRPQGECSDVAGLEALDLSSLVKSGANRTQACSYARTVKHIVASLPQKHGFETCGNVCRTDGLPKLHVIETWARTLVAPTHCENDRAHLYHSCIIAPADREPMVPQP